MERELKVSSGQFNIALLFQSYGSVISYNRPSESASIFGDYDDRMMGVAWNSARVLTFITSEVRGELRYTWETNELCPSRA